MRTISMTFAILLLALAGQAARAESFACGKNQENGPEQSEIGYIYEAGERPVLYLDGKVVHAGSKSIDNDHTLVGVDQGKKGTLELLFSARDESVTKTLVSDSGVKKSLGKKKCIYVSDADDDDADDAAAE